MSYFTVRDISLVLDKSAECITINLGPHAVTMRVGEWARLISAPKTTTRVLVPLHVDELVGGGDDV